MATCFTISLMFLLMTADVDGWQDLGVNYNPSYVCALRGSTVRMSCIYPYYEIKSVYWTKTVAVLPNLCSDSNYRENVQCHSHNSKTYNITLTHVTEADKGVYYCRFINGYSGEWSGRPGVQLDVTDLQVETQQRVKEGDSVTLTCKTTCSLTEETTFIWYRNTQILPEHTVNKIHLQSVSRDDSGVYRCAAGRGSEHLSSPGVYLSVEYAPRNVSVSISSSGVIVEGDSVTLTCSSESNPPVQTYSWFKENQTSSVGSGQMFSISDISSRLSGWFYCMAQNKHGSQRSAAVSFNVKGVQSSALVSGIVAGCGGLFFVIIFIILFIWKKFIINKEITEKEQEECQYMNFKLNLTSDPDSSHVIYSSIK